MSAASVAKKLVEAILKCSGFSVKGFNHYRSCRCVLLMEYEATAQSAVPVTKKAAARALKGCRFSINGVDNG
jgi:hypothetical protein